MLFSGWTDAAAPADGVAVVPHGHPPHLGDAGRPAIARSDDVAAGAVALVLVLVFAVIRLPAVSRRPGLPFVPAVRVRLPSRAEQIAEQPVRAVPRPE